MAATGQHSPAQPATAVQAITVIMGSVVGLTFLFGFGNVLNLALRLGVPVWVAPLVAPAVDLSIFGLLLGTRHLALTGAPVVALRPARRLLVFASAVTLALNVADPLVAGEYGKAAFDAVGPLLLIGWAEVGPGLLQAISATHRPETATTADCVEHQNVEVDEPVRASAQCPPYRRHGKPWHRTAMQNLPDYDIVQTYAAEYRGVINYYLLAIDVWRLQTLNWNAQTSMLKTLAAKHKSTVTKMAARHRAKIETPHGLRTCFEARVHRNGKQDLVARFGGIPLARNKSAIIVDRAPVRVPYPRKEIVNRLVRSRCELCEGIGPVVVHHVAKLTRLGQPGPDQPAWAAIMATKRRKALVVCRPCHDAIHATPVTNAA
jgi:hypothetical protein